MDDKQTYIFGYLDLVEDVAYCPKCADHLFDVQEALGYNVFKTLRHTDAIGLSAALRCAECAQIILFPVEAKNDHHLEWWREALKGCEWL